MAVLNTPKTDPATLKKAGIIVGFFALILGGTAIVYKTTAPKPRVRYIRVTR
jgi:hypothetical protein